MRSTAIGPAISFIPRKQDAFFVGSGVHEKAIDLEFSAGRGAGDPPFVDAQRGREQRADNLLPPTAARAAI